MNYQPTLTPKSVFEECLSAIEFSEPPKTEQKCHHCGLVMRYPLIARQSDLDNFKKLMEAAQEVLDRNGVTALLLSEVRANAYIAIAKKSAS